MQFKSAYKRLLMRHNIQCTGNCTPIDNTTILNVYDGGASEGGPADTLHIKDAERLNIIDNSPSHHDHDYVDVPNISHLSEYKEAAIGYIAGYVVKMARKKTHCASCQEALTENDEMHIDRSSFFAKKNRGGLIHASESVVKICCETEKCFQQLQKTNNLFHKHQPMPHVISTAVIHNISRSLAANKIFSSLETHMFETDVEDNHVYRLVKLIAQCYYAIRMHHIRGQ